MCVAWGLLAPIGILIAMFYKVIWPNGEWFYVSKNNMHPVPEVDSIILNIIFFKFQSHLGIMIGTLVLTICGLVLIIVHASGTWLSTTVCEQQLITISLKTSYNIIFSSYAVN